MENENEYAFALSDPLTFPAARAIIGNANSKIPETKNLGTLMVHTNYPIELNAEPKKSDLETSFITPNSLFFIRNHAKDVPLFDHEMYRFTVTGLVMNKLELGLKDLKNSARFPKKTVIATIQCAGNRRQELLPIGSIGGNSLPSPSPPPSIPFFFPKLVIKA